MLGLASDVDHSSLVPDYTKSTEALYKELARHLVTRDACFSDTSQTLTVRGMEIDEIAVLCTINRARNRQTPPEQGDEIQDILFGWLHAFTMHPGPVARYGSGAYDAFCRTLIRNRVKDSRGALVLPSDEYLNMMAIFYKHTQPPVGFVPKTENGQFEYTMSFVRTCWMARTVADFSLLPQATWEWWTSL